MAEVWNRPRSTFFFASVSLLAGCTFTPGGGFTTLSSADLEVSLEPGVARDLGDDTILTDQGYAVAFEELTLGLEVVDLEELQGGGVGGGTFDPSDPPPGYSLCHGGHCHRDDGALIDYADIEAELAGGAASFVAVASLPVGLEVDLLSGLSTRLNDVEPSPLLPLADVTRIRLAMTDVHLVATVTGGPLEEGEEVPLSAELPVGAATSGFELTIDRDIDPTITLTIALHPGGSLLDGLDLSAGGGLELTDLDSEAAVSFVANLAATEVAATWTGEEE